MGKAKNKITNWAAYNRALTQRGSITFWVDESAIKAWTGTQHHGKRGRGFQFSDVAIETALKAGELKQWKIDTGYHNRSLSETAMYRYKTLTSGTLSLRSYNAQVGEVYANVKAINKVIRLGMPERNTSI